MDPYDYDTILFILNLVKELSQGEETASTVDKVWNQLMVAAGQGTVVEYKKENPWLSTMLLQNWISYINGNKKILGSYGGTFQPYSVSIFGLEERYLKSQVKALL